MGVIRLVLALSVVYGHAAGYGIVEPHTQTGILYPIDATLAVEMFFVISGFYMGLMLEERYRRTPGWVWRFYATRYLRLMPGYLVVLAVFTFSTNPTVLNQLPGALWPLFEFSSLTLIGIDLTAFYEIGGYGAHTVMPISQAWSLGIEIWFYLLVPALVRLANWHLVLLGAAICAARYWISDAPVFPWQQRLFPLELYFFVLGLLAHRLSRSAPSHPAVAWVLLGVAVCAATFGGFVDLGFWKPLNALMLGAAFACVVPLIFAVSKGWRMDRWIGELSYPLYLVHVQVGHSFPWSKTSLLAFVAASLVAAVALMIAVDVPVDRLRHRFLKP